MKKHIRKLQKRGGFPFASEPFALVNIKRTATRPEAVLNYLSAHGVTDVSTENVLEVRMESIGATERAVINLNGTIGKSWWDDSGITAEEFDKALNEIPAGTKILLRINSEGGSIKEGLGIYDSIAARSKDITARNVGYALSIASVFPLAAGKIESPDHAIWMIHEGWMTASGNKRDMLKNAEMLGTHDKAMAGIYAKKTGKSADYWAAKMESETWFTGAEAIENGLADETGDAEPEANAAAHRPIFAEYLNACKNVPPNILNALKPVASPTSAPQGANQPNPPTPKNIMDKKTIVALLKKHGIEASETETIEQLQAKLEQIPQAKAPEQKPAAAAPDLFGQVNAAVAAAVARIRLSDKINAHVDRGVITKVEAAIYTRDALVSAERETEILALLEAKQAPEGVLAGSHFTVNAPERIPGIEGKALPEFINGFKAIPDTDRTPKGKINTATARYNFLKDEWPALMAAAQRKDAALMERSGFMPVASNTYSASLLTNFLIMGAITQLSPQFAPLAAFTRDNSVDPIKPLAVGQMKFNQTAQDGSTAQTAGANTNFENSGDSVVNNVAITPAHYFENMHIEDNELNSGLRMEDLVTAKFASLGSKCMQVVGAIITAANYTAPPVIKDPSSFSWSDMRVLWGQLKKSGIKNIILDGEYLAQLQNIPSFLQTVPEFPGAGWKNINNWNFIGLNTEWSQSGNNIRGFACNPQAIGIINGVPLNPPSGVPGNTLMTTYASLPGLNTTIAVNVWFSLQYRRLWSSLDIILGAAKLDSTAGVVIAGGTPS